MAEAPTGDETLREVDLCEVVEALLEAKNKAYDLGLKLKLPPCEVESICSRYQDPQERLTNILLCFLKRLEPRPTWSVIVDALRSSLVNLPRLAERVEAAHLPKSTATPAILPQGPEVSTFASEPTTGSQPAFSAVTPKGENKAQVQDQSPLAQPGASPVTVEYVEKKIKQFEKRFNKLKWATRDWLKKLSIPVVRVVDALADLPADDVIEHKQFLEGQLNVLYQTNDLTELFGSLNYNMNYLSYHLVEHLIREFDLGITSDLEAYKEDLRQFRANTPLKLFYKTQKKRHIEPPSKFERVVAKFDWPADRSDITLEDVEKFRQEYAYSYSLRECAMMLAEIFPNCFIVSWLVPASIVKKLKENVPVEILSRYFVTELTVAGECVAVDYSCTHEVPIGVAQGSSPLPEEAGSGGGSKQSSASKGASPAEKDYRFVERPSEDFYCPVAMTLLLEPQLTSCCGKHLSPEAATRVQREGRPCPMCKTEKWSTVLDKHYQRQVKALPVFCSRKCQWKGELSELDHHLQRCPEDSELLAKLEQMGVFSKENLDGLARVMKAIDYYDLVDEVERKAADQPNITQPNIAQTDDSSSLCRV